MKLAILAVCAGVVLSPAGTARGQVRNWATPADGLWRTAGNWNPANVPDTTGETALLGLTGAYNVSLQGDSFQVGGVQITNPLAELRILQSGAVSFTVLNIVGDLTN
ncbi:MAG: hypothetical protein IT436_14045, partial [Phycisphaerales bacterium]|nr:hypothetical protein [Phycisphaerales bacterium]